MSGCGRQGPLGVLLVGDAGMRTDTHPNLRPPQTPGMAINTSLATDAGHQLSGEWSFGKQRTVNPLIALCK